MAKYIISLDAAVHQDKAAALAAIATAGATVTKSFNFSLTFEIEASEEQKNAIVGLVSAESAEAVVPYLLQVINDNHLKLTLVDHDESTQLVTPAVYNPLNRGTGQHIYLIDTGIRQSHEQFSEATIVDLYTNFGNDFADLAGHGTMVGSLIVGKDLGPAKDATLYNVKLFNTGTDTITVVEILQALDEVLAHHLGNNPSQTKVACMPWVATRNAFIDSKILELNNAGVVVVCAAGNNSSDVSNYSPAGVREVITVGAHDQNWIVSDFTNMPWDGSDAVQSYNNFGAEVDIFAPGSGVQVANNGSDTGYTDNAAGTSLATGITAGVVAQYIARYPSYTAAKIKDVLVQEGHLFGQSLLSFATVQNVDYSTVNKSILTFDAVNESMLTTVPSGRIASVQQGQTATVNLGLNMSATNVSVLEFAPLPPWVSFDASTGVVSINTASLDPTLVPGAFVFAIKGKIDNITKVEEFSIAVYATNEEEIEGSTQYYYDSESGAYDPVVTFQVAPYSFTVSQK
jgi:subtilisin family serine protease